jgi:hypothetical protein
MAASHFTSSLAGANQRTADAGNQKAAHWAAFLAVLIAYSR